MKYRAIHKGGKRASEINGEGEFRWIQ